MENTRIQPKKKRVRFSKQNEVFLIPPRELTLQQTLLTIDFQSYNAKNCFQTFSIETCLLPELTLSLLTNFSTILLVPPIFDTSILSSPTDMVYRKIISLLFSLDNLYDDRPKSIDAADNLTEKRSRLLKTSPRRLSIRDAKPA